jgi:hypothetical protein
MFITRVCPFKNLSLRWLGSAASGSTSSKMAERGSEPTLGEIFGGEFGELGC